MNEDIFDDHIDVLNLNARCRNAMIARGVVLVRDLVSMGEGEVLQTRSISIGSLEHMRDKLERHGLRFGMKPVHSHRSDALTALRDHHKKEVDGYRDVFGVLCDACKSFKRERDEARREVCAHEADTAEDQRQYAEQRGWDCFPQSEEHTTISYKETP